MTNSLHKWIIALALIPIAILPETLKEKLKNSSLESLYTRIYSSLGRRMGSDLYRIEGGPLKGNFIFIDPGAVRAYLLGNYEPVVTHAILELCRPGMTTFDIGAHNGYFSMLMAKQVGPTGRCIAFEPFTKNFEGIQSSISKNEIRNLLVERIALGEQPGISHLRLNDNALMGRLEHLVPAEDLGNFSQVDEVEVQSLDAYMRKGDIEKVDFIKLDVEGAERDFLKGAEATLIRHKPCLLVEVHTFIPPTQHAQPFLQALHDLGYGVVEIESRRPVCIDDFMGGHILAFPGR